MNTQSSTPRRAAFSLIEMMITMALLGFIVVGLTAMFVQTQRAFRGGMAQTDVLESGRAATELVSRELELAAPAYQGNFVNFYSTNPVSSVQKLPGGGSISRTNFLGSFDFLTHNNLSWARIGYLVSPTSDSVGTLYRYEGDSAATNWHRVADGIVHLRVQTYSYTTNYYTFTGALIVPSNATQIYNTNKNQNTIYAWADSSGQFSSAFTSNAVPAYVELELGVLENAALKKLQALPSAARAAYLAREQTAGRVHIFRRHIAVRNVDPEAYR